MIQDAPVKELLVDMGYPARVWLNWFSAIGDALKGDWYKREWDLSDQNLTYTTSDSYLVYHGSRVFVQLTFTGLTASNDTILLPTSVKDSFLNVWDGSTLTAFDVTSNKIMLTDGIYPNITIKGELIIDE